MPRRFLLFVTTAGIVACGRASSSHSDSAAALRVVLDTARGRIAVHGLSSGELNAFRSSDRTADQWEAFLRVSVGDTAANAAPQPAVLGRYAATDSTIEFTPRFPLDPGRPYRVRVDPSMLFPPRAGAAIHETVALRRVHTVPSTRIVQIHPTGDAVPENLLRLYVEFSAPMSRVGGLGFVKLLDENGREVPEAFLPLEADFWNEDRTRYTLFLDPGRVKQGLVPNQQLGRALIAGQRYSIQIDSAWRDANGLPLVASHRKPFWAQGADTTALDLKAWRVSAPTAGNRGPVIIEFPERLDHGLLARALGVASASGRPVPGEVTTVTTASRSEAETDMRWHFTPSEPWRAGSYDIVVLSFLEDLAGNRVGRAFEVDQFSRIDKTTAPERYTVPFTVR